jgi:chaperonin GroES
MFMKIVPLGANVVIKRLSNDEMTAGGVVLPDTAKQQSRRGRVLSVGDGRLLPDGSRVRHQVSEGDLVLLSGPAGAQVAINGDKLWIVSEDDILAVVL